MLRTPNRHGGGARTNYNGLGFEQTTSLDDALETAGYQLRGSKVYSGSELIGYSVQKYKLYNEFLAPRGVEFTEYNSKQ